MPRLAPPKSFKYENHIKVLRHLDFFRSWGGPVWDVFSKSFTYRPTLSKFKGGPVKKTTLYATQKPEMEEMTGCCQRRLRDAKTCFVFFRRLGRDSFPWRSNAPILYGSVTPPTGPIRPLLTTLEKPVLHFENLLCIMKVVNRCSDRGFQQNFV